jgi:hypothetical protein
MQNLRRRLDEITSDWSDFQAETPGPPPSIIQGAAPAAESAPAIDREISTSQVTRIDRACLTARLEVESLFFSDGGFAEWAEQVVNAFGLEPFPTYQPKPPDLKRSNERNESCQLRLTGFDDPVQSGLQIIIWAAASKKASLLWQQPADWWHNSAMRAMVKEWAYQLIIEGDSGYSLDPAPMQWVRAAFEHLEKSVNTKSDPQYLPAGGPRGKGRRRQKSTVNARMLATIQENPEAVGWTCTRWAKELKCAKSAVVDSQAWRDFTMARERVKAERATDRRRRPKASDQKRD